MAVIAQPGAIGARLLGVLPILATGALSLGLLLFVARGEALRVQDEVELERLQAVGEALADEIVVYLELGLPLDTFVAGLFDGDSATARFGGFDSSHLSGLVLLDADESVLYPEESVGEAFVRDPAHAELDGGIEVTRGEKIFSLIWPLRGSQDELVGELVLSTEIRRVQGPVRKRFRPLLNLALVLLAGLGLAALLIFRLETRRAEWGLQLLFGATVLALGVPLVMTLVAFYRDGAEAKVIGLTESFSNRIEAYLQAQTGSIEARELAKELGELVDDDPEEIRLAALIVAGEVVSCTDPDFEGKAWSRQEQDFEYRLSLEAMADHELLVVLYGEPVRHRIYRSVRNSAALLLACCFLSFLFLRLGLSLPKVRRQKAQMAASRRNLEGQEVCALSPLHLNTRLWVDVLQVVWFSLVFTEGLSASFLPNFIREIASGSGTGGFLTASLFAAFFLGFVLMLVPAGVYSERREIKGLLMAATALIAAGLFVMARATSVEWILFARLAGGMGHGAAFIAVQSYLLEVTQARNRARGSAAQVFAQNSGVISGAVIGALLVVFLEEQQVFLAGSAIAVFCMGFVAFLLPRAGAERRSTSTADSQTAGLKHSVRTLVSDLDFLRTTLLIGATSKVVYNGVIFFAIPMILREKSYLPEEIGQVLMLFAGSVLLANYFAARLADRMGHATPVLFIGMVLSGSGAFLVGLMDWPASLASNVDSFEGAVLIVGVITLGLANGFIAAPIVSHVLNTQSAETLGYRSSVAIYRFLERTGHVIGPLILGQLLLWSDHRASAVGWLAGVLVVFGLLFAIPLKGKRTVNPQDLP